MGLRLSKTEDTCSLSLGDELPEGVLDDSPNGADAGWLTDWRSLKGDWASDTEGVVIALVWRVGDDPADGLSWRSRDEDGG